MRINMSTLVFVYGTLRNNRPNHYLLKNIECVFKGRAKTVDTFPLVVASRYNVPYLLHKPGTGKNVSGELYAVNPDTLAALDELEGHPYLYERNEINVTPLTEHDHGDVSNDVVKANAYFLVKYQPSLLELPFLESYTDIISEQYVKPKDRNVQGPNWWYEVHTDYQKP